jgi:phospholipase C
MRIGRVLLLALCLSLVCCGGGSNNKSNSPVQFHLSVSVEGTGTVTSNPAGISCPSTCTASFDSGTVITLTATAGSGFTFSGFSGACKGTSCSIALSRDQNVTAAFSVASKDLSAIKHIVFMLQENRSFDHYFGHLNDYWSKNNFPQSTNGTTLDAEPPTASNNGIPAFPLISACVENPSPSWDESHIDRDRFHPTSTTSPPPMDGFVQTAAGETNQAGPDAGQPYFDSLGQRVMGFYTDSTLNYYSYMASTFGTSDSWFSPVLSRTEPNRLYLLSGTSGGRAYPKQPNTPPLQNKTIFEALDDAGISWKIYTSDPSPSFLTLFTYYNQPGVSAKVVPANPDYFNDLKNGTLPQVAMIEAGYGSGLDEHPTGDDTIPGNNIQTGANYISSLINKLMSSTAWSSSVFILTWDEGGGFYDHVPPQPMPSPDGIPPIDLRAKDVCLNPDGTINPAPVCQFETTGFRVPLIVVSPFTKNVVSHTVRDYTSILKLIEMRYNVQSLTARDAAQADMLEFFDFTNAPWTTPPSNVPVQSTSAPCVILALSALTISPNPAVAGAQANVKLLLNKAATQNATAQLSSMPAVSDLPSSVSIVTGSTSAAFSITVPTGTSSLTITGNIGGIALSGTVPVQ